MTDYTVYTDGSCVPNPGTGGLGVVRIHNATGRLETRSERPVFVTQFTAFSSGDLVKIDAYDMEPVPLPDGRTETRPGVPVRLVMPKACAAALRDMLLKHLEKNPPVSAATGVGLAGYAEMLEKKAETLKDVVPDKKKDIEIAEKERHELLSAAEILRKYAVYPSTLLKPIVDAITDGLLVFPSTDPCPSADRVGFGKMEKEAGELYGAVVCYVRHCVKQNGCDIAAARDVFQKEMGNL